MTTCQNCGAAIYGDFAAGFCPNCLVQVARGNHPYQAGSAAETPEPLTAQQLEGRIPGIKVFDLIGRGGMGAVYRAHQVDLDRSVAIKILPSELARDPLFVERFRQEARALARIDHPNIVRIFGSGVADDLCYIVMELVEGVTLREAISQRSIDPQAALRIIPQICSALEFAHARGIVHRDIKPENILLGRGGTVKVADFGLAKLSSAESGMTSLTVTGTRLGTLRYMAPEQFDGENVDHRSDIYALGVVIYELLTGQVPMGHFPPPSETPGVDPRIDAVVMRTLQREPARRYQHVSEIETDLYKIAKGEAVNVQLGAAANASSQSHPSYQATTKSRSPYYYQMPGREWKSQSTFMGYPLLHVAFGFDPRTQKKFVARGVIAIGDVAIGGLALGGLSIGLLSFGGLALGLTALGGMAVGLQAAFGGGAIGGLAIGGASVGGVAIGGGAVGLLAMGGGALGYVALGGGTYGTYKYDWRGWSDPSFSETWLASFVSEPNFGWWLSGGIGASIIGPLLLVIAAVIVGLLSSSNRKKTANPMPSEIKRMLLQNVGGLIGLAIAAVFIFQAPFQITSQIRDSMQQQAMQEHLSNTEQQPAPAEQPTSQLENLPDPDSHELKTDEPKP